MLPNATETYRNQVQLGHPVLKLDCEGHALHLSLDTDVIEVPLDARIWFPRTHFLLGASTFPRFPLRLGAGLLARHGAGRAGNPSE